MTGVYDFKVYMVQDRMSTIKCKRLTIYTCERNCLCFLFCIAATLIRYNFIRQIFPPVWLDAYSSIQPTPAFARAFCPFGSRLQIQWLVCTAIACRQTSHWIATAQVEIFYIISINLSADKKSFPAADFML